MARRIPDGWIYCCSNGPGDRIKGALELGKPFFSGEGHGAKHVAHCEMYTFDDTVTSQIFDGGWNSFDVITLKKFLKFLTKEFIAIAEDDFGWSWAVAQPFSIK